MALQAAAGHYSFNLSGDVDIDQVLPNLNVQELAALHETNQKVQSYLQSKLGSPDMITILEKYGFDCLTDPRNVMIIDKAFEACRFEGEGDGLTDQTLTAKMKIVEDRNLIRIYLRSLNKRETQPAEKEFLQAHPELEKACCLNQITDAPKTADAIRQYLQKNKIPFFNTLRIDKDKKKENSHPHDRYITLIPPEIRYFNIARIDAYANRLMLISKDIDLAIRGYKPKYGDSGTLDIRRNHLGTIPNEVHHLFYKQWIPPFGPEEFHIISALNQEQRLHESL